MPVPLRTTNHRAEAKYNVTTEFPSLGLHSAAATGDVGLVEYALEHGQPINSVLDGVLPLHAACAGGSERVVKMLIEHGADVNAPRLPRRYSNDKNRDTSAPIVGTSGSTPLHFAAANGNTNIITILLHRGAHANRADKHGVTPEMLARQHGWLECAEVLRAWILNKDRDLRERESRNRLRDGPSGHSQSHQRIDASITDGESSFRASSSPSGRRRLHVKQSIDTALNMLKSSSTGLSEAYLKPPAHMVAPKINVPASTPPGSPRNADFIFRPISPNEQHPTDGHRRPSLPQIYSPAIPPRNRKVSAPINRSPSPPRPRSAGHGAEDEDPNYSLNRNGVVRKVGSKYSLMNIFKKGQPGESGAPEGSQKQSSLSAPAPNSQATPTPAIAIGSSLSGSPQPSTSTFTPPAVSHMNPGPSLIAHSTSSSPFSRNNLRFHRSSDASSRSRTPIQQTPLPITQSQSAQEKPTSQSPPYPELPLAVDAHNAFSQQQQQKRDRSRSTGSGRRFGLEDSDSPPNSSPLTRLGILRAHGHKRDRSGSGSSSNRGGAVFDDDIVIVPEDNGIAKQTTRPGILRAHNRSSSSGQGSAPQAGFRALRFDSFSSQGRTARDSPSPQLALRASSSVGSLGKFNRIHRDTGSSGSPPGSDGGIREILSQHHHTGQVHSAAFEDPLEDGGNTRILDEEDEVDDYGEPIYRPNLGFTQDISIVDTSPMESLMTDRGLLLTSSSESSLSPILAGDSVNPDDNTVLKTDFPFSINRPPSNSFDNTEVTNVKQQLLSVPLPTDNRSRGDSVSSTSTTDSRINPQLSASETTTSGSAGSPTTTPLVSPGSQDIGLPSEPIRNEEVSGAAADQQRTDNYVEDLQPTKDSNTSNPLAVSGSLNGRRAHPPLDIDISSISSHAQAEALVQLTQQNILSMEDSDGIASESSLGTGRTPLSARLAAYGESLAIERKLREQKQAEFERTLFGGSSTSRTILPGVERQHSLENRSERTRKSKPKDPRRPSTAEGFPGGASDPPPDEQPSRSHQPSHSTSALHTSPRVEVDDEDSESPIESPTARGDHVVSGYHLPLNGNEGHLSRISSLDGLDTDTDLGPALFRVSTAPISGLTPPRGKREQARSANKLTRMGFSPSEQARHTPPPGPQVNVPVLEPSNRSCRLSKARLDI
ncbi:hypothetical protein BD779DRAFT_1467501 [Infundibulicybe gibba]|nr:hypothetical protein BD779DRAFT_1467501 [Infundibulicybe gibba]